MLPTQVRTMEHYEVWTIVASADKQTVLKDRLHCPNNISCEETQRLSCSMCKTTAKSIFYMCKLGRHIICEKCQLTGGSRSLNDDGDYMSEKECVSTAKKESTLTNKSGLKLQDLASGDHMEAVESLQTTKSKKYINKTNMLTKTTVKHLHSKSNSDTKIVYRNEKFQDNKSSVNSSSVNSAYQLCKEDNFERVLRPVTCPVTSCARMVTMESISQHFNFDHSKVPRMILNKSGPQEISLNHNLLSTETNCIASFVLSQKRSRHSAAKLNESPSNNMHNLNNNYQILLLMAAKMLITPIKLSHRKCQSRVSTRNSYTQTEDLRKENEQLRQSGSKHSSKNTIRINKTKNDDDDNDEVILIWLCKLEEKDRIYSITLSGEDKTQAYCYIGDAIHIRKEQDSFSIYTQTQCLSLRKPAINKLLTTSNELKVIISTVL